MDITGTWNIEKAMGKSTVGAETAPFIQFEDEGKMYGNASVNRFFGNYQLKGNKLKFSNLGMTLMLGASMDIEDAVKQAIDRSNTIKADDFKAYIFGEKNDIRTLSDAANTIPYEFLCAVSKRVPRVYK